MGIIDAPPLNLSCGDKATTIKPIKVEKGGYRKVKQIDDDMFHIWYDVDGCGETTLAITPLKSERQAKKIKKEIMSNADDIIFWQEELIHNFGEVSLVDVIDEAKKYRQLVKEIKDIPFNALDELLTGMPTEKQLWALATLKLRTLKEMTSDD